MKTKISTLLFILLLAISNAQNLAAQINNPNDSNPASTNTNPALLLGPPTANDPVVVRAAFQLQDITEIDDEAEKFQFTGILSLIWQDKRQAFGGIVHQTKNVVFGNSNAANLQALLSGKA